MRTSAGDRVGFAPFGWLRCQAWLVLLQQHFYLVFLFLFQNKIILAEAAELFSLETLEWAVLKIFYCWCF